MGELKLTALAGGGCATSEGNGWKVIARGEPLPNFDVHARLMTLPGIFGSTPEDVPNQVPYLSLDEDRVDNWRRELEAKGQRDEGTERQSEGSRRMRVGLVWQGSTAHKGDRFRSIALSKFKPLAQIPGVQLVSLQKGYGPEQIEALKDEMNILEWGDASDTTAEALLDTAAVMKCLDLVVTVDTSMCHLAGALGVPVWVAMPLASDWRWLTDRDDSPWYPTMRLFRQKRQGDWDHVIHRMAQGLRERVQCGGMQPNGEHVVQEQPVLA